MKLKLDYKNEKWDKQLLEWSRIWMDMVLFGKLSASTFFTLNASIFRAVWRNVQNRCNHLRSLSESDPKLYCIDNSSRFPFSGVGKGGERKHPVNCQYN